MSTNLVNELQISAEQDDVLTVLRKTKRLASKLARTDICAWLNHELDGYPSGQALPEYRIIGSTVCYNTNGYVPAGFGMMKNGIEDLPFFGSFDTPLHEPISSVVSMIESLKSGKSLGTFRSVPPEFERSLRTHLHIDPNFESQVSFLMRLDAEKVKSIPDQVKNKILDWACELEAAGVCGDGMSFSMIEKKNAQNVTLHLTSCTIEQVNALGANSKGPI